MWLNSDTWNYWVEVGYWVNPTYQDPYQEYFWADYRPVDAQNGCPLCVNVHIFGSIPQGDYGLSPTFTIRRASVSSFNIFINSPNKSWFGLSTDNYMDVGNVRMGQELAGTYGAFAPDARFSYRYYWDPNGNYIGIYNNYYFNSNSSPPYIVSMMPGSTDFYTYCC